MAWGSFRASGITAKIPKPRSGGSRRSSTWSRTRSSGRAALALAREAYLPVNADDPEHPEDIQKRYAGVIADYPQSAVAAQEAFVYLQASRIQACRPQSWSRAWPPSTRIWGASAAPFPIRLYNLQAIAYSQLHKYPQSLAAAIRSLETLEADPTNPTQNKAVVYFQIGLAAQYDVGDFATARLYYQKFLQEYPKDQKAFTVRMQLQRLDEKEAQLLAASCSRPALPPGLETKGARPP